MTFLPFRAPASSCFSLFLCSDLLTSFFSSLTLPTSALPSFHFVGSLTSKLPSIIWHSFLAFYGKFYSYVLFWHFYLASILTSFLASFLTFSLAFFLISYVSCMLRFFLASMLGFYLKFYSGILSASILTFYSAFLSRIHFGILSSILSDIQPHSCIYSDIHSDMCTAGCQVSFRAHWDLALAVEVRQCPLRSGTRRRGRNRRREGSKPGKDIPTPLA